MRLHASRPEIRPGSERPGSTNCTSPLHCPISHRHLTTPNPELARNPPAMAGLSPFYCCIVEPRCRLCQFRLEEGDPVLVGTCPAAAPSLSVLVT